MSNTSFNWPGNIPVTSYLRPKIPSASSHTPDLPGLLGALHDTQHVLEMFRRTLTAGPPRRLLDRLANRLTKIASEACKLGLS
jgi:hypothetical protein